MQVPPDLKLRYLARRIQEIHLLKRSLYLGDYSPALKLGHQIKGNAATFDFEEIGPLGKEIEKAAHDKNKELVEDLIYKIERILFSAEIQLR